jgi:Ca2+-binding RTX toxin-like protein
VSVRGGAGADRPSRAHLGVRKCNTVSSRLFGGTGADHLLGSKLSDDHLIGGRGRDVADGLAGIDTCRAEVTRHCESGN